jgi:hypothetical protein
MIVDIKLEKNINSEIVKYRFHWIFFQSAICFCNTITD